MLPRTAWVGLTAVVGLALLVGACAPVRSPAPPTSSSEARGLAPTTPAAGPPQAAPASQPGTADQPLPSDQAITGIRKIIYTGDVQLEVANPVAAMDRIQLLVQDVGGYVASSNTFYQNDKQVVTMSLRVPAERYGDVLAQLRRLADKVREEKTTSQDVSEEYADLSAQLRNLEATEAQYLELMKRAQSIDDVLKVQQQLTAVRGQIERIKGRLTYLDRRSDLATINVGLFPLSAPASGGYANPLEAAAIAWEASLRFLAAATSGVVAVIVFFWWAAPPAVLATVWLIARLRRRRTVSATAS
jgi:hypothetical protein